jgi:hypothetical protein
VVLAKNKDSEDENTTMNFPAQALCIGLNRREDFALSV